LTGGGRTPISAVPYIAEARFTYAAGEKARPWLQVTGGLFHYNYNLNIKDLGLYLLRGSVYPGLLISGFETRDVLPIANVLGLWARHAGGIFTHDLILQSETELKPYFDLSLAYIGQARVSSFFSFGAGVNFYRLLPGDFKVSHHPFNPVYETAEDHVANPYQREFIYVDTDGGKRDTSYLGFDGTKVMADFEFDPKPLFASGGIFGPEDLKLYGEAAVMGLNFDKAHEAIYGGLAERVPVMFGFNIPAFGFLDHLSLEAEWYGAKFRDDLERLQPHQDDPTSPIPVTLSDTLREVHGDDYKWALHAAKTIQGHFKISAQVANDHFRPGGTAHFPAIPPTYETATTASEDWYWMAKIVYFF
jgi:hypothetical protein